MPIKRVKSQRLTYPKEPPYKLVLDYVLSKHELTKTDWPNYQWDKPRHSINAAYVSCSKVSDRIREALERRRRMQKIQRIALDNQWRDLDNKEGELRATFIKLASFVKGNSDKRERAKERLADERRIYNERVEEILDLKTRLKAMHLSKIDLDVELRQHKLYERYLNDVAAASESEFKNADHIIGRYEDLNETKKVLGDRQGNSLKVLEESKVKMGKMTEEHRLIIVGLLTHLATLNSRYQTVTLEANHWDHVVEVIMGQTLRQKAEMDEVRRSCWNMYRIMCLRKNETAKLGEEDVENQLLFIKRTLRELRHVREQLVKAMEVTAMRNRKKSSVGGRKLATSFL